MEAVAHVCPVTSGRAGGSGRCARFAADGGARCLLDRGPPAPRAAAGPAPGGLGAEATAEALAGAALAGVLLQAAPAWAPRALEPYLRGVLDPFSGLFGGASTAAPTANVRSDVPQSTSQRLYECAIAPQAPRTRWTRSRRPAPRTRRPASRRLSAAPRTRCRTARLTRRTPLQTPRRAATPSAASSAARPIAVPAQSPCGCFSLSLLRHRARAPQAPRTRWTRSRVPRPR